MRKDSGHPGEEHDHRAVGKRTEDADVDKRIDGYEQRSREIEERLQAMDVDSLLFGDKFRNAPQRRHSSN
jgi:hypothetical protein